MNLEHLPFIEYRLIARFQGGGAFRFITMARSISEAMRRCSEIWPDSRVIDCENYPLKKS